MKPLYMFMLLGLVGLAIFWPAQQARSQDTLVVPWSKDGINPVIDTLRSVVFGDTTATGARTNLNRVYKLQKGGLYWLANRIENTQNGSAFPLRLVGEAAGTAYDQNPPLIQLSHTASGGNPDSRIITGLTDVTLKNLYITGREDGGAQTNDYQPITMTANNSTFIIDNCILEQSNFAVIAFTGKGNTIYYTNNKLRNLVERPITQQWTGRGSSIWADQDTVIFENNTFFNVGCFDIQIEGGSAKYVRFNHNTIVLCGRQIAQGNWWQNAYIANNLIINGFWEGEGTADLTSTGRDPRQIYNGLFTVGSLPSVYGVPNEARRIVIAKNYAYLDPRFTTRYATDGVQRAYFVDPVTKLDFTDIYTVAAGNHMYVKDTVWLTSFPAGMTDPLDDPDWQKPQFNVTGATMVDSMWASITTIRANLTPGAQYVYKQNSAWTDYTWPLPENFSYTDANLLAKGTDGLNIGDLNWFPTQKATFEANKSTYIAQTEALAGQVIITALDTTAEAENATVASPATVQSTQGLTYYEYSGSGSITWTFDVTNPGEYDTKWLVHETGRGMSGPVIAVNGHEIHDKAHMWGQFIFDNALGVSASMPNDEWIWVPISASDLGGAGTWSPGDSAALTLAAGSNTISVLGGGWGTMRFSEVDIVKHGTTDTIKFKAPDAVTTLVTPGAVGVVWVASGFKYVDLGTDGSITFALEAPTAGNYHLRIFGQNITGSAVTLTLKEGSATLASPVLPFKTKSTGGADSTGNDVYSAVFPLTAGNHTVVLSGSNVSIDYVQLIRESVATGVGQGEVPLQFALEQNYPNPFNPTTTINFTLASASNVKLIVYNILGQKVATLIDSRLTAGAHTVQFDASKFSTGVYIYSIEAGDFRSSKKMLLIK